MIRMIATDFDGTLVPLGKNVTQGISEQVKPKLRRWMQNHSILIATGRHPSFIGKVIHDFSFDMIVGYSGNLVFNKHSISFAAFTRQEITAFLLFWKSRRSFCDFYCCDFKNEFTFADLQSKAYIKRSERLKEARPTDIAALNPLSLSDVLKKPLKPTFCRAAYSFEDSAQLEKTMQDFALLFPGFHLVKTGDLQVEILAKNRSKASEIQKIADSLGIDHQEITAIGDNDNDLEMLRDFSPSYYVGNKKSSASQYGIPVKDFLAALEKIQEREN